MKRLLCGLLLVSSLSQAEELRFLKEDRDALQARVDLIQASQKELLVEYYSVWNDDQSIGGMALLLDAAHRGVKVKVIMDALSNTVPTITIAALLSMANNNLEIKVYNPLNLKEPMKNSNRDHAKMMIADGEYLIAGGRNVGDKYFGISVKRNFTDLDIMVRGKAAADARENFLATWNSPLVASANIKKYSTERLGSDACKNTLEEGNRCESRRKSKLAGLEREQQKILKIKSDIETISDDDLIVSNSGNNWFEKSYELDDVKFISHDPTKLVSKESAFLNKDLLSAIASAEEEVNLVAPYFIPTRALVEVFKNLLAKKVKIKVITNSLKSTDNLFAQGGYRAVKEELIKLGIEVWEFNGPNTIHAKTGLVDNKTILIGTYNIDPRSAFLNREIGIIANDSENTGLARELEQIISNFRESATLVGKDGVVIKQKSLEDVGMGKKILLKITAPIVPLIKDQL